MLPEDCCHRYWNVASGAEGIGACCAECGCTSLEAMHFAFATNPTRVELARRWHERERDRVAVEELVKEVLG